MRRLLPTAVILGAMVAASTAWADPRFERSPGLGSPSTFSNTNAPAIGARELQPGAGVTEKDLLPLPATGQRGVQVRTNMLSGKNFQAGPTIDLRPSTTHPEMPVIAARRDATGPVELGGFVGYLFHDETSAPSSSVGFDLQLGADPQASTGGWLVQPGLDYSTVLGPSWQLNTRLFSTYASENYGAGRFGLDRPSSLRSGNGADPGLQDVGVGLGLGYAITDKWNVQTQARYQRMLGSSDYEGQNEASPHQFFGGVMVDYKF